MTLNAALREFAFAYLPRGQVSITRSLVTGLMAFAVAFLVRSCLSPWVSGLAFLTFYPAILIAALLGGSLAGLITLVLGVLAGGSLWLAPVASPLWGVGTLVAVGAFLAFGGLMIGAIHLTHALLLALQDAEERASLVAGEMRHRVANLFQLVQSIARLSANHCSSKEEFLSVFSERLKALSASHADVARQAGGISIRGLLEALAATYGNDRLIYEGPDATADPDITLMLGLVLHELATNAAKYGALATNAGQVNVSWERRDELIQMHWLEKGGPPVPPLKRQGAGTRLLESAFRGEGGVDWRAGPEGIAVEIAFRAADKALPRTDGA
ncbi:sensor histidine kinase [Mesorhizobium sp. J8]|uniref:sensor histidine kinase n=1 Tax=Mesorhizobium sp. J8 TaxID=2777475 RepID=UPI001915B353|nr:sensor histidine kinase [Mesorhizobium sp. J8]BCM19153.1 blue-light-activated histidine kinase 1 [Mesorhizobium sp. J8]